VRLAVVMSCAERLEFASWDGASPVRGYEDIAVQEERGCSGFGLTYKAIPEGTLSSTVPTVQSSRDDSVTPSSEPVVGGTRVAHGDSLRISISILEIDWGWIGKPETVT
jgi:hypothetical protein